MASSGKSALGWCNLAGPPWTLGPVSPISRRRRQASSSPCSRMMSVRSALGGALPASCMALCLLRPSALDLLLACLLGRHRPGRDGVRKTRRSTAGVSLSSSSCSSSSESSCCWEGPWDLLLLRLRGGSCSCLCCGLCPCLCPFLYDPSSPGECRVKVFWLVDSLISEIGVAALSLVDDRFVDGPELIVVEAGGHVWHVLLHPLQVLSCDVCAEIPRRIGVERGSRGAVRGCCCTGGCCFLWGAACSTSSSTLRGGFWC